MQGVESRNPDQGQRSRLPVEVDDQSVLEDHPTKKAGVRFPYSWKEDRQILLQADARNRNLVDEGWAGGQSQPGIVGVDISFSILF